LDLIPAGREVVTAVDGCEVAATKSSAEFARVIAGVSAADRPTPRADNKRPAVIGECRGLVVIDMGRGYPIGL